MTTTTWDHNTAIAGAITAAEGQTGIGWPKKLQGWDRTAPAETDYSLADPNWYAKHAWAEIIERYTTRRRIEFYYEKPPSVEDFTRLLRAVRDNYIPEPEAHDLAIEEWHLRVLKEWDRAIADNAAFDDERRIEKSLLLRPGIVSGKRRTMHAIVALKDVNLEWCKIVSATADIDLDGRGGYMLKPGFQRRAIVVIRGSFIAGDSALYYADPKARRVRRIKKDEQLKLIDARQSELPAVALAQIENRYARHAMYCWLLLYDSEEKKKS
jgi:hypothetical protein